MKFLTLPIATLLLLLPSLTQSWDISLRFDRLASNGVGGEELESQPVISVHNKAGTKKQIDLIGTVVATLAHPFHHQERLGIAVSTACDSNSFQSGISVHLSAGEAHFSGLCINKEGSEYSINFVLLDEFGITLGQIVQSNLSIDVGEPFQIGVIEYPKSVYGGIVWDINPVVAVQDKGKNTVTGINNGTVMISLAENSLGEQLSFAVIKEVNFTEVYKVISPSKLEWRDGVAEFHGISINRAGYGYHLLFSTDLDLRGSRECQSGAIDVLVGNAAKLRIIEEPGMSRVYGGKVFLHQPLLHVLDKGNNIVKSDSSLWVAAILYGNPTKTPLKPREPIITHVKEGVAKFKNMFLEKAGEGYRLQYFLLEGYSDDIHDMKASNVTVLGNAFDVLVGDPEDLKVIPSSIKSWAGNQPFRPQPKVFLVDAGGNVLKNVSSVDIDVVMVQSLSLTSDIVIDTLNCEVPDVERVTFHPSILEDYDRAAYSAGHVIYIDVQFSEEVVVQKNKEYEKNDNESLHPSLILNVMDRGGKYAQAYLSDGQFDIVTDRLTFAYEVSVDYEQPIVDILNGTSLLPNDYTIRDAWGRDANLSLPHNNPNRTLQSSKVVAVNNDPTVIQNIRAIVEDGYYGSGHNIGFVIEFTNEVLTNGLPKLALVVKSLILIIDTKSMGTSLSTSYFFIIYKNERSRSIPWDASASYVKNALEEMSTISGSVCVSRSHSVVSAEFSGYRWAIRFEDVNDDLRGNVRTESALVTKDHKAITLSSNLQLLDEPFSDWKTTDGDISMCTFRYATYVSGAGSKELVFHYHILPGDEALPLGIQSPSAIQLSATVDGIFKYFSRKQIVSTNIAAGLNWNGQISNNIFVDTNAPNIVNVTVDSTCGVDNIHRAGDEIFIHIIFDKPIVILGDMRLQIWTVRPFGVNASFYAKPGRETVTFRYFVEEGHWSHDLDLKNASKSVYFVGDPGATIFHDSTYPVSAANLNFGEIDTPSIRIDGKRPVISEVFVTYGQEGKVYEKDDAFIVAVKFSCPVVIIKGPPVMIINAGSGYKEADYFSGNNTSTLHFQYIVEIGDKSSEFLKVTMLCIATGCFEGSSNEGYIRQLSSTPILNADLTLPKQNVSTTTEYLVRNILHINTRHAPKTSVTLIDLSHDGGNVGVGEVIRLHVTFSDRVYCQGDLKLRLNTNSRAVYESGTGTKKLIFVLKTKLQDVTKRLNWEINYNDKTAFICDPNSRSGSCSIINGNHENVDLALVDDHGQFSVSHPLSPAIEVSSISPRIISVHANPFHYDDCPSSTTCVYTAGDIIIFNVKFDHEISIRGYPRIKVACYDGVNNYVYATFDADLSNETNAAFKYIVLPGHTTESMPLSYYYEEIDVYNSNASIKRKSTYPIVSADLLLPDPAFNQLRSETNKVIVVDAIKVPSIKKLSFKNTTGTYSPGDRILMAVEFDKSVEVSGIPVLLLDVGRGKKGCAFYSSGSNTVELIFHYDVGLSHCTDNLEYVGRYSLVTTSEEECKNVNGWIKRNSGNSIIDADLTLPSPGNYGSLSFDSTLSLDCRVPYISKIWSPQSPGIFNAKQKLSILVQFSRPVIVRGSPMLKLETGSIDRWAHYTSKVNDSTLEFEYVVRLGDTTDDLDYWTNEDLLRSSVSSFNLNGGSIMVPATEPVLLADIHINPSQGNLQGLNQPVHIDEGEAEYFGLKLGQRGNDYRLRFISGHNGQFFQAETGVTTDESCEYEVNGNENDRNFDDGFGSAVALWNGMLAVGAPKKRVPKPEIQILKVQSDAFEKQLEVQIITTQLDTELSTRSIQKFSTFAAIDEEISGIFSLGYKDPVSDYFFSSEIFFTANAEAQFVKEQLTEKLPILNKIEVNRYSNTQCNCKNGWIWEVTFFDASGGIGPLLTNGIALEGRGAGITESEIVSPTNMLQGSFTLLNPFSLTSSRNISFAATAQEMKSIIEQDLSINIHSVQAGNLDPRDIPELGRRWIITYSSHIGLYGEDANVPNLMANGTYLNGANSKVWTYVEIEGKSPLQGSMAFSFRGSNYSSFIPFDASAEVIKQALESLESINEVAVMSVRQSLPIRHHGFTWAITFHSVNVLTDYGWMIDPGATSTSGNIPALVVETRLIGWNAKAFIESVQGYGESDTQSQWMLKEMGDDGHQSGEVVIYRKANDGWITEYYLNAKDRSASDQFGHSIAFGDDMLVVGAPNKEVDGVVEQQTVTCILEALDGTFTLSLRGRKSDPISIHSSLDDIQHAIQGVYGDTDKVHSMPRIEISADGAWSQSTHNFCSSRGNSFTISFLTPDGGGVSTIEKTSGDIELLEIDEKNITGGKITITETRKGTRTLSGSSTLGIQSGAVYLFERKKSCRFCPYEWQQSRKLTLLDCLQEPEGSEQFGWTVAMHGDKIFVGAPGFRNNTGNVYIFQHKEDGTWICEESLTGHAWKEVTPGARFGYSIGITYPKTLLVGLPGYSLSEGCVIVFRQSSTFRMLMSQKIASPIPSQGTYFGHSISSHNNSAIICAPNMMEDGQTASGACFTFERRTPNQNYIMKQKLVASNVRKFDRFGWSVAMSRDKVLVGQLQEYDGKMAARSAVQTITMRCGQQDCSQDIESRFQLSWRDGVFTTNPLPSNISAKQLKQVLENELHTGPVQVHRTDNPDKYGGFQWSITFIPHGLSLSNENVIPKLNCETRFFRSASSRCDVEFVGGGSYHVRGKVHLFTPNEGLWVEQAYLFPTEPQLQDFFGHSIALDANVAVVGAPSRNLHEINSGAAIIYDLSFANYYFNSSSYTVEEGATLQIPVFRRYKASKDVIGVQSLDINAGDHLQTLVKMLWGPFPDNLLTPVKFLTGNSASTNDQYYGSMDNRSEWISGMYDYRAMNDYQSLNYQFRVATDKLDIIDLKTVDDHIFETPNEKLTIQISLPGMFASPLGQLRTEITIEDNGDGVEQNETYYSKICKSSLEICQNNTSDMDILSDGSIMVVGHNSLGLAQLYSLLNNKLVHLHDIYSPSNMKKSGRFGDSVSIDQPFGRDDITILIGEPGRIAAHIYVYDKTNYKLLHQAELSPFGEVSLKVEHNFAGRKSVKVDGDLTLIGASNLDVVFIYRRIFDWETSQFSWHPWTTLRASAGIQGHGFGTAIASSSRKILVSAPNVMFSSTKDFIDTFGHHKTNLGRGYVYGFYSRPHSLQIECVMEKFPSRGTFKVKIVQNNSTSSLLSFDETDENMKRKLESLSMLGEVTVRRSQTFDEGIGSFKLSWTISLISTFQDEIPKIMLLWNGHNCNDCEPFMSGNELIHTNITITHKILQKEFVEDGVLRGGDPVNEDCFGFSVDIDGDRAVVGAPCSSANPQTSWDFETGNLIGWFKTGDAFDYQPTYGDNSRKRTCYSGIGRIDSYTSGQPQDAQIQGRYYIGTYEKRPGDPLDFLSPNQNHQEGDIQGDEPVGTLTSDPFVIHGNKISFLIGGGCDYLTVYVELLVDGFATMRATGQCHETMERIHWDVTLYKDRSAQIRIVDGSSDQWGHINIDDIKFSWTGGDFPISESSSKSGVAYAFRRYCKDRDQGEHCAWIQEQRLVPSDKRTNNLFGVSVAIDEARGTISVGSPKSPLFGFYKDIPGMHPLQDQPKHFPVDSRLEHLMKSGDTLIANPGNLRLLDNFIQNSTYILPMNLPRQYFENAGAIYIYTQQQTHFERTIERSKVWSISEQARLSPPNVMAHDLFGSALKRTKSMIVVNSESDSYTYFFNLKWENVKFSSVEYVAVEGVDSTAMITVLRDDASARLSIGYSTSDLTAIGVDRHKFHACSNMRVDDRQGCGDYEQSSGILTFAVGQNKATFNIQIMNDSCWERQLEYIQLNLHIPGAGAIHGERFRAQLRIDDDDWMGQICPTGIS